MILYAENHNKKISPYKGNWPYYSKKDSIKGVIELNQIKCPRALGCECDLDRDCESGNCLKLPKGQYCKPVEGTRIPRFRLQDQFGDLVDIYDFYGSGKYILIELSAAWCGVCHELASWITYNDTVITEKRFWKDEYKQIKDMIINDEIYFIHIQFQDEYRDNATQQTIEEWYSTYPDDKIPVLGDFNRAVHTLLKPTGLPVVILLNDKLEIVQYSNRGFNHTFDKLIEIYN